MAQLTTGRSTRGLLHQRIIAFRERAARSRASQRKFFFRYPPFQSPAEERANALIHGAAALASLAGAVWLAIISLGQGDPAMILGCASYATALTAVFTMSTLSHVLEPPRQRHLFRTLDQACIYLLTAGSCTPYFIRFLVPHGWGWMLVAVWCVALVAVWNKLRGHRVNSVSITFNVLLGWLPVVAAHPLLTYMPPGCVVLVILTAALYMLGVVFLCYDERGRYFHAVWHTLVVAASACTYAGIALYVV